MLMDNFDEVGINKPHGSKYETYEFDARGFDIDGNNKYTGTKYDEDGFDMSGYNKDHNTRDEVAKANYKINTAETAQNKNYDNYTSAIKQLRGTETEKEIGFRWWNFSPYILYFSGLVGMIVLSTDTKVSTGVILVVTFSSLILAYFIQVKDSKYAFLLYTILFMINPFVIFLNKFLFPIPPIVWVIANGIYLYNRWDHPRLNKKSDISLSNQAHQNNLATNNSSQRIRKDVLERTLKLKFIASLGLLFILVLGNIEWSYDSPIEDIAESIFGYKHDGMGIFFINTILISGIIYLGYRHVVGYFSNKMILKELKQYLEFIEVSNDEQLAELIIFGAISRKDLMDNGILNTASFENLNNLYIDEQISVTRLKITLINNELANNPDNLLQISGNNLWLMTLRATDSIDSMLIVKKVWRELDRGYQCLDNVLEKFENDHPNALSEWVKTNVYYKPKI